MDDNIPLRKCGGVAAAMWRWAMGDMNSSKQRYCGVSSCSISAAAVW